MRRFEQGLAFCIRSLLAGQPILTYQELYERAIEVKQVKTELRTLNPINQKRKGFRWGTPSESVNKKKPSAAPPKIRPASSTEPCGKCGRTNHTTLECQVGINKCMWCENPEYFITACLWRLKAVDKGATKPLAPTSPRGPTINAYSSRMHICNEREGSCHLGYSSH